MNYSSQVYGVHEGVISSEDEAADKLDDGDPQRGNKAGSSLSRVRARFAGD